MIALREIRDYHRDRAEHHEKRRLVEHAREGGPNLRRLEIAGTRFRWHRRALATLQHAITVEGYVDAVANAMQLLDAGERLALLEKLADEVDRLKAEARMADASASEATP